MANTVKTAISMQEKLFQEVNILAGELHVSRSKLFVMAVQDFIKKNENKKILSQINKAFADYPDPEEKKIHNKMRSKQLDNLESESW